MKPKEKNLQGFHKKEVGTECVATPSSKKRPFTERTILKSIKPKRRGYKTISSFPLLLCDWTKPNQPSPI